MAFEFFAWAVGFALEESARRLGTSLFGGRSLEKEFSSAADDWAAARPAHQSLYPQTLFQRVLEEDLVAYPALRTIRKRLREVSLPTLVEWHQALIEQWQRVRASAGVDAQPFFLIDENEARFALHDLARAIQGVCERDDGMFKRAVLERLRELGGTRELARPLSGPAIDSRAIARAIEDRLNTTVELVILDRDSQTLTIWAALPGVTISEVQAAIVDVALLSCAVDGIQWIDIGIGSSANLEGSDGRGPVGIMRLRIEAQAARDVAVSGNVDSTFWEDVRAFVIADDNTDAQRWEETPFRRFLEGM